MSSVNRAAFLFLVVIYAIGGGLPAMASLRDYGIYLSSIGGSTLLRLDNRIRKYRYANEETNTLTSTTEIHTKGFIWDPRFMTVDLSLRYSSSKSTSKTETDSYDINGDVIGFGFRSTLFPRWRYPYAPIHMSASKVMRSSDGDSAWGFDTDYTLMSLSWGLVQKQLGRVRMRYNLTLQESARSTNEEDSIKNRFQVSAKKDFLKAKWGETNTRYGYYFDSYEDKILKQLDVQHQLFMRNSTKLGKKAGLNSRILFYQRYYDGRGDAIDDDQYFSATANLRIKQTDRLRHNFSIGLTSDNGAYSYYGTANTNYTYAHDFDKYLKGVASTGAYIRYSGGAAEESSTRFNANVSGRLIYAREYDAFWLNAGYNVRVKTPTWSTGSRFTENNTDQLRFNQVATLRLSRRKNPLYSDAASLLAQHIKEDETTGYLFSADYSATSKYEYSSKISSLISGNVGASESSREGNGLESGVSAALNYQISRSMDASVNARQRWRKYDTRAVSLYGVRGALSGQLYRRFNVRFFSELEWTRRLEEWADDDDYPSDETRGIAGVSSSIGKLITSVKYTYRETDIDGDIISDQSIVLQIKRFFGG